MPVAYLPSPARGLWYLGPVPVRAYALCIVLGVVAALWVTDRRYRADGRPARHDPGRGHRGGARRPGRGAAVHGAQRLAGVLRPRRRLGLGVPRLGRRAGHGRPGRRGGRRGLAVLPAARLRLAPMALAAVPALAVAQAVGHHGATGSTSGCTASPSGLPWAVAIDPVRRASGYESFSTFQPVFLYESLWDIAVAVALVIAIRRWVADRGPGVRPVRGAVRGGPVRGRGDADRLRAAAAGHPGHRARRCWSSPSARRATCASPGPGTARPSPPGRPRHGRVTGRGRPGGREPGGGRVAGGSAPSVPGAGFEPARPFGQMLLRHRRLPFRHPGINRDNDDLNAVRSRPGFNLPVPGRFRRP